ncbi:unnamed protein product, partial [Rotaria magnacalcarata]
MGLSRASLYCSVRISSRSVQLSQIFNNGGEDVVFKR